MSLLVGHSLCARDLVSSAFGLQIRRSSLSENKRSLRWDSPKAAIISNFHLPMHSLEFKTRTSLEDIKRLRLITAIKTPYLPDGRFDLGAYDSLIQMQIANGVEAVVVGGTTGEGHLMSRDERILLIAHTITCFGAMLKVIGAGAGSNSTREAIRAAEQGFAVGMHAALHTNPYYGKTSMEGLLYHFESLLSIGPTIIYNAPSRTGQDVPPTVIYSVAENPKECMGFDRIEDYVARGLTIWSGDDDRRRNAGWVSGSTGVISVASNLVPGMMHDLMFKGANSSLSTKLTPLFEWLCCEPNPIGLNTALAQLGVIRPIFRLPYVPLQLEERVSFVKIVEAIGRENFVGEKDVQALEGDDFTLLPRY